VQGARDAMALAEDRRAALDMGQPLPVSVAEDPPAVAGCY